MKALFVTVTTSMMLAANSAYAVCDPTKPCSDVPEIDALAGTAALAAVAATVALVWERRRK
ncbi:MAG: VPEID-CTERM sorting domain-containing protein [Pseudomonadota bacterium]